MSNEIDLVDENLAELLGQNARQSSGKLANKLMIDPATVRRRIKRLIQNDVLRIVGVVDPAKFGLPLAVLIAMNVAHDKLAQTLRILKEKSFIRLVSTTTGRYDIIILAVFSSNKHLSKFLAEDLAHIKGLRETETFICLDMQKGHYIQYTR